MNFKKKVILVTPYLYPCVTGGAEVFNYYLAQQLSKSFDVECITHCFNDLNNVKIQKIPFKRTFIQQLYIFMRLLFVSCDSIIIVSFMKTKWRYIAIYPLLNMFLKKKYVLICHSGGLPSWEWSYPYRCLFKRADKTFGVSKAICREYKKRTKVDLHHLPPVVPFNAEILDKSVLRKDLGVEKKANVFLSVGSLKVLKRPMDVLSALSELGQDYLKENNVVMIFAGDGEQRAEMQQYIAENNLKNHVLMLGNVPREDIHKVYKLSDTFIMASDYEGMPISMLEAMSNGMLILGSDTDGIKDLVGVSNAGFLFCNRDYKHLAQLMRASIENPYEAHRKAAVTFFEEKFNYEKIINQFSEAILS